MTAPIIPIISMKEAIRWRDAMATTISDLIADYEKRVIGAKVEAIQIRRVEVKDRRGLRRSQLAAAVKVVLDGDA